MTTFIRLPKKCATHEEYIRQVARIGIAQLGADERRKALAIKLTYGAGPSGVRGVTYYKRWNAGNGETAEQIPFVEISAFNQESLTQLAGTTLHELGHVLAGWDAGHDKAWKDACERLGLVNILAAGTEYTLDNFKPDVAKLIAKLPAPCDGNPVAFGVPVGGQAPTFLGPRGGKPTGCNAGIGVRGGKSRGQGSGSRLRLFMCEGIEHKPYKVRLASDTFEARCECCKGGSMFTLQS